MPTIAEKARAEAEAAEAENPDETEADTPPAEPGTEETAEEGEETEVETPAEEPPATDPDAMRKGIDRAMTNFYKALCRLFEVEELIPVPMQGALGFMLPGIVERKTHENFTRCLTCNGHGTIDTGSFHAGDETAPCPDPRCKGRGYWQKAQAPAPAAATGPLAVVSTATENGGYEEAPKWMGDPGLTPGSPPPAPAQGYTA